MIDILIAGFVGMAIGSFLTVVVVSIVCEAWKDIWK